MMHVCIYISIEWHAATLGRSPKLACIPPPRPPPLLRWGNIQNQLRSNAGSSESICARVAGPGPHSPLRSPPVEGGARIHPENARMSCRHGKQYVAQCVACAALTMVVWQSITNLFRALWCGSEAGASGFIGVLRP